MYYRWAGSLIIGFIVIVWICLGGQVGAAIVAAQPRPTIAPERPTLVPAKPTSSDSDDDSESVK